MLLAIDCGRLSFFGETFRGAEIQVSDYQLCRKRRCGRSSPFLPTFRTARQLCSGSVLLSGPKMIGEGPGISSTSPEKLEGEGRFPTECTMIAGERT